METTEWNCLAQSEFMWRQISRVVKRVFLISILFINILGLCCRCQNCVRAVRYNYLSPSLHLYYSKYV